VGAGVAFVEGVPSAFFPIRKSAFCIVLISSGNGTSDPSKHPK
jgi:hypothetical protein